MLRAALPEVLKTERHTLRGIGIRAVHGLNVEMGLRGVPGVAASADLIADAHPVTGRHLNGASLKVHESNVMRSFGNLDDDVVSKDGSEPLPNPLGLTQSVRDECQYGAARLVVGFAVVNRHHGSCYGRVQGTPEDVEELWRFGGEDRAQAARRRRATVIVDGEEVKRVRGAEQVGPVARDAARGTDLAQPPSSNGSLPMTPPSGMGPGVFLLIAAPPSRHSNHGHCCPARWVRRNWVFMMRVVPVDVC